MPTRDDLIAFENDIANVFNSGAIRAPVHLAGGNEDELIRIFEQIRPGDWITGSWRMHYHCLLKGVPPEQLKADILAGRSITLCYPKHRIVSSAIVGGSLPIALGIAWSIKRAGADDFVWAFCGDMTARTGIFGECARYASGHDLRIQFIVEDNGLSVCTPTDEAWWSFQGTGGRRRSHMRNYVYKLPWPHAGAGVRVQF